MNICTRIQALVQSSTLLMSINNIIESNGSKIHINNFADKSIIKNSNTSFKIINDIYETESYTIYAINYANDSADNFMTYSTIIILLLIIRILIRLGGK